MQPDCGLSFKGFDVNEFRRNGHELIEFVANYYETLQNLPPTSANPIAPNIFIHSTKSQVSPNYLSALLPLEAPKEAVDWSIIFEDFKKFIIPGMTHWQSPNNFAYFPANSSDPAIMGELLSATFNCVGFSWVNSPAMTELEIIVMDWMAKLIGLPSRFQSTSGVGGGVIQGTSSEALIVALLAAKGKAWAHYQSLNNRAVESEFYNSVIVYGSDQTHSSLVKACRVVGIPSDRIRILKTYKCHKYALQADELLDAMQHDHNQNLIPLFVVATIGTTNTCAIDNVSAICASASRFPSCWVHVDGAYLGAALIDDNIRLDVIGDITMASSVSFNAHKALLTNFDCCCFWIGEDRHHLTSVLSITPEYMKNKATGSGSVMDLRDWQIPLGRRFRALKLWFVIRKFGLHGLRQHIHRQFCLANHFATLLQGNSLFELLVPPMFGLVCFRILDESASIAESATIHLIQLLYNHHDIFIIGSKIENRSFVRAAFGAPFTTISHVEGLFRLIESFANAALVDANTRKISD